ncbi:MAG: hypothetical protein CMN29_23495 [Sandaracinus sp.]|nr:hypothetical protein [Sandaracinus sp.]
MALAVVAALVGCGEEGTDLQVERLPEVEPNLPPVPTLPPPPHPTQYDDSSYSIYGARARLQNTLDSELSVTGYIVDIYQPPECDPREPDCRVAAPHMWIADTRIPEGEVRDKRDVQMMVVGYAENQEQIDEAVELAERGRYEPPDPESGLLPIPTDFHVGNKVKVTGQFMRVSSSGFNNSEGLLEYRGHETIENVAEEEE